MKVKVDYYSSVLFARLPLTTVKALHREARSVASLITSNDPLQKLQIIKNNGFPDAFWDLLSSSSQEIDFLPLKITATAQRPKGYNNKDKTAVVYTSYNGGDTRLGSEGNVIELHPSLFHDFEILPSECDVVALPWIPNASRVRVHPCSVEDWELLECCAEYLQEGGLLSQVSVVYPNQIIPLSCSSYTDKKKNCNSVAHIRVLDDECFSLQNYEDNTCLRLVQETLIEIIPYPRNSCWSQPLPLSPIYSDVSTSTQNIIHSLLQASEADTTTSNYLSQLLNNWKQQQKPQYQESNMHNRMKVFLHPNTLRQHVPNNYTLQPDDDVISEIADYLVQLKKHVGGIDINHPNKTDTAITVADLIVDETIPVGYAALPTLVRYELGLSLLVDSVELKLVKKDKNVVQEEQVTLAYSKHTKLHNHASIAPENSTNSRIDRPSWRLPSNAFTVFPNGIEEAISNTYDDNKYETLVVPSADHIFHWMPTTHTSVVGQEKNIMEALSHYSQRKNGGCGLVISGEEGNGKTHISLIVANLMHYMCLSHTVYVDCKRLQTSSQAAANLSSILKELTDAFQDAYEWQSSLIVLDDLDYLIPNVLDREDSSLSSLSLQQQQTHSPLFIHQVKVISDHLRFLWDKYCCYDAMDDTDQKYQKYIRILCTCKEKQSLHPSLLCLNKLDSYIRLPSRINGRARFSILHHMIFLQQYNRSSNAWTAGVAQTLETWLLSQRLQIEQDTDGYRISDLFVLACRIHQQQHKMSSVGGDETRLCWKKVIQDFIPLSLQSSSRSGHRLNIHCNTMPTTTTWSDVGGLFHAKELLEESIVSPIRFHKVYSKCLGIKLPRGILLYGPSGCGKTFMVSALANRCHLNVVTCKGPELLDKYIGASEAKVRQVFENACAASPCLLFFDDFDALAPKRGSDNTGVTDRVVNQLLTLLDGVETFGDNVRVYIVAATSRPDKLDAALLRPGRLDRHIYIGLPKTDAERRDLAYKIAKKYPLDATAMKCVERMLLQPSSVQKLVNFSPADFKALFTTAYLEAIDTNILKQSTSSNDEMVTIHIHEDHLLYALEQTRPSMSNEDRALFENIYVRFRRSDDVSEKNLVNKNPEGSWGNDERIPVGKRLETAMR